MNKPYVYKRAEDLGIPVVDAKVGLTVTVTDDDVIKAKKADSKHCALARAALRLPKVNAAYFFRSTAFIEYADKMVRFHLPESVTREIVSFDRAHVFASGSYRLIPCQPSQRIGRPPPQPAPSAPMPSSACSVISHCGSGWTLTSAERGKGWPGARSRCWQLA